MSLTGILNVFAVWCPAIKNDPKTLFAEKDWSDPYQSSTIYIRTAVVFSVSMGFLIRELFKRNLIFLLGADNGSKLSVIVAAGPAFLWERFEKWRVNRLLWNEVHRLFREADFVPESAINYMLQNPEALQKLIQADPSLLDKKCGVTNANLVETVVSQAKGAEISVWKAFELLVRHKKISGDHFLTLVDTNETWAISALKADLINEKDFSSDEKIKIWKKSSRPLMQLLKNKNWDINIANESGITPLKAALIEYLKAEFKSPNKLCELLALGANFPASDEKISYSLKKGDQTEEMNFSIQDMLNDNPELKALVDQAPKEVNMTNFEEQPPVWTLTQPLVNVSIINESFRVSDGKLMVRAAAFAALFYVVTLPFTIRYKSPFPALGISVIGSLIGQVGYFCWAHNSATRRLNEIAVTAFKRQSIPWSRISDYISKLPSLIYLLSPQELQKIDDAGGKLWEKMVPSKYSTPNRDQWEVFKVFTDKIFSGEFKDQFAFIREVFKSQHASFIQYLLPKMPRLTDEDAFFCWTHIKDPEIAVSFSKLRYPVDVRDKNGWTPLFRAVRSKDFENVEAILAAKPDLLLQVEIQVKDGTKTVTAMDLESTEPIKTLLSNCSFTDRLSS